MKTLSLSNYDVVPKDAATLKVVLFPSADGTVPPPLYLRGKDGTRAAVITKKMLDDGTAKWSWSARIDTAGIPSDYIALVKWWFEGLTSDKEYRELLNETYAPIGTVGFEINKAKSLLIKNAVNQNLKGEPSDRRTDLNRYLKAKLARALSKVAREKDSK